MNKKLTSFVLALAIVVATGIGYGYRYANTERRGVGLIRFHVLANSDSPQDQQLKLKVRDRIIAEMKGKLSLSSSVDETREILNNHLYYMKAMAKEELEENNSSYDVQVMLGDYNFPTKKYGDVVLAAGKYEALRIVIGEGEGQNWWCVMFPPLCFIDIKKGLIDEATRRELKNVLSEEEYQLVNTIDNDKGLSLELRSKVWDLIRASREQIYKMASKF